MTPLFNSLLPAIAMALLLGAGLALQNNPWLSPLGTAGLLESAAFLLPLLVFWIINRRKETPLKLRLKFFRFRFIPFTVFAAIAVSLLSFFLNYLMAALSGGALLENTAYGAFSRYGGEPTWALVLVLAVVPAVVEELFFRGGVLSGLENWGQGAAILIAALCFSLAHGSLSNLLGPLVAGLVYGYMTVITGSVWPAVFAHLFNNCLYLIMGYSLKRYAAFGIWPYFVILSAVLLFVFTYLAASSLEKLVEKGRVPRLRGGGGWQAMAHTVVCPGTLAVAVLFVVKIVFFK